MDVEEIAFLGLYYMEDMLEHLLDWQEHSILAPQGLIASKDKATAAQPRWSICCYCLSGHDCVPNPISPGFFRQGQTITNPLSLLCSSDRKFGFFPLFSTWFENFTFGVNAACCPTCFSEGIKSSVFLQSVWTTRGPRGLHLLWLSFLTLQNSFHSQQL